MHRPHQREPHAGHTGHVHGRRPGGGRELAAYNQDTNQFGHGPEWVAVDAQVDRRALHELYLPAFKATVQEGDAASVVCSYNRLNGYYACENDWLLNQTLRRDWGFEGFVVADWYFSTRSTVNAVMAGLDISMPGGDLTESYGFPDYYGEPLVEAVQNGSVPSARIDDMVARVWRYMFKLGQIDNPVTGDSLAHVRTQAHLDLTQQMVEDGAVLLKNNEGTFLPSATGTYHFSLVGQGAAGRPALRGVSRAGPRAAQAPQGVRKIALRTRESALVELHVDTDDLKVWDADADGWVFVNGTYDFMLGFSAGDISLHRELVLDA